jgi:hypothetical protein
MHSLRPPQSDAAMILLQIACAMLLGRFTSFFKILANLLP